MAPIREKARRIAQKYLDQNDPVGWFEALYSAAKGDAGIIPWAEMVPNPNLVDWLDKNHVLGAGKRAIIVGCGLGDDAEELVRRGFEVVAFDISQTAIAWCRSRFPYSPAGYVDEDLFDPPPAWEGRFDFVLELYTLQVLPPEIRPRAIKQIARFVAPGGTLLAICRGRNPQDSRGRMPWPLLKRELEGFKTDGLSEVSFEDYMDEEIPPARRFRVEYRGLKPDV